MALPVFPNALSASNINVEVGRAYDSQLSWNDNYVRFIANPTSPSGSGTTIAISDLHGKSYAFIHTVTISSAVANFNQRDSAVAAGWDQVKPLLSTVTVTSTGVVYSTSTGSYAYSTGTSFPTGSSLTLINSGYIIGKGGAGGAGAGAATTAGGGGASGGPALYAGATISISNYGYIGGGGGGGGGGGVG